MVQTPQIYTSVMHSAGLSLYTLQQRPGSTRQLLGAVCNRVYHHVSTPGICRSGTKRGGDVARLCRRFGISRETGYKWMRRFETSGEEGLLDQSCRPRHSLAQIARAVEEAILQVRAERFHRTLKAEAIANRCSVTCRAARCTSIAGAMYTTFNDRMKHCIWQSRPVVITKIHAISLRRCRRSNTAWMISSARYRTASA